MSSKRTVHRATPRLTGSKLAGVHVSLPQLRNIVALGSTPGRTNVDLVPGYILLGRASLLLRNAVPTTSKDNHGDFNHITSSSLYVTSQYRCFENGHLFLRRGAPALLINVAIHTSGTAKRGSGAPVGGGGLALQGEGGPGGAAGSSKGKSL